MLHKRKHLVDGSPRGRETFGGISVEISELAISDSLHWE